MGKPRDHRKVQRSFVKRNEKKLEKFSRCENAGLNNFDLKHAEITIREEMNAAVTDKKITKTTQKELERYPLLCRAVFLGCRNVVDKLLAVGESPNMKTMDGITPLIIAIEKEHASLIQLLLQKGADPTIARKDGTTPLMISVYKNNSKAFSLLWKYMDETNSQELNQTNSEGYSLLMIAVQQGFGEYVKLFLSLNGIEVDKQNNDGKSALMLAVMRGHQNIVEKLLAANCNILLEEKNGATALCFAIVRKHREIIDMIYNKMNEESKEKYVQKRIELLYNPRIGTRMDPSTFYKTVLLLVILEIRQNMPNGISLLYKHKVFVGLFQCADNHQKDTDLLSLIFHVSACLIYDKADFSRYIVSDLADHFVEAKAADFSLKIILTDCSKNAANFRATAFLPLYTIAETVSGQAWLKDNYAQLAPHFHEAKLLMPHLVYLFKGAKVKAAVMLERFEENMLKIVKDPEVVAAVALAKLSEVNAEEEEIMEEFDETVPNIGKNLCIDKSSSDQMTNLEHFTQICANNEYADSTLAGARNVSSAKSKKKFVFKKMKSETILGTETRKPSASDPKTVKKVASIAPQIHFKPGASYIHNKDSNSSSQFTAYADALKKNLVTETEHFDRSFENDKAFLSLIQMKDKIDEQVSKNNKNYICENSKKNLRYDFENMLIRNNGSNISNKSSKQCNEKFSLEKLHCENLKPTNIQSYNQIPCLESTGANFQEGNISPSPLEQQDFSNMYKMWQELSLAVDPKTFMNFMMKFWNSYMNQQVMTDLSVNKNDEYSDSTGCDAQSNDSLEKEVQDNAWFSTTTEGSSTDLKHKQYLQNSPLKETNIFASSKCAEDCFTGSHKNSSGFSYNIYQSPFDNACHREKYCMQEPFNQKTKTKLPDITVLSDEDLPVFQDENQTEISGKINSKMFEEKYLQAETKIEKLNSPEDEKWSSKMHNLTIKNKFAMKLKDKEKSNHFLQEFSNDKIHQTNSDSELENKLQSEIKPIASKSMELDDMTELKTIPMTEKDRKLCSFQKKNVSSTLSPSVDVLNEPPKYNFPLIPSKIKKQGLKKYWKHYCHLIFAKNIQSSSNGITESSKALEHLDSTEESTVYPCSETISSSGSDNDTSDSCSSSLMISSTPLPKQSRFQSKRTKTEISPISSSSVRMSRSFEMKDIIKKLTHFSLSNKKSPSSPNLFAEKEKPCCSSQQSKNAENQECSNILSTEFNNNYDCMDQKDNGSNGILLDPHPSLITCEFGSKWHKLLKDLLSPKVELHRVNTVVGKLYYSTKIEHTLKNGEYGTYIGLICNRSLVVVRQLDTTNLNHKQVAETVLRKKQMKHSSLVILYDAVICSTKVIVAVTNLCEYSLTEYLNSLLNSTSQFVAWFDGKYLILQLIEAVTYLHKMNVIHGHLKPSNVLITSDYRLKVSDFYLLDIVPLVCGVNIGADENGNTSLSDSCWRPREVIVAANAARARSDITMASDIQMVGMLVYYILSGGKHPFGEALYDCQMNIVFGNPSMGPFPVDVESRNLIEQMIQKIPSERPSLNIVAKHPYFWDLEKRFQFLLHVGRKIDFFVRKPTKVADMLRKSCKEASDWTFKVNKALLNCISNITEKVYENDFADFLHFSVDLHENFDMIPQFLKSVLQTPSRYISLVFPAMCVAVYDVLSKNVVVQKQMELQTFF